MFVNEGYPRSVSLYRAERNGLETELYTPCYDFQATGTGAQRLSLVVVLLYTATIMISNSIGSTVGAKPASLSLLRTAPARRFEGLVWYSSVLRIFDDFIV